MFGLQDEQRPPANGPSAIKIGKTAAAGRNDEKGGALT